MQDVPSTSNAGCEAEWSRNGGALNAGDGLEIVVSNPSVLDELELLFESDAVLTRNVGSTKPEIQKAWWLLGKKLSSLKMTVLTDSLRLVKFGWDVIKKIKFLVQDLEVLEKTVTDKNAFRENIDKELAQLKSSVAAFDAWTAKLTETKKCLDTICSNGASLKEEATCADKEKADSDKIVDAARKES